MATARPTTHLTRVTDRPENSTPVPIADRRGRGYRASAVLLGIVSLGTFLPIRSTPLDVLGFAFTPLESAELVLSALIGLATTWALWTRRPSAPEYYLAWSVVILAATIHLSVSAVGRLLSLISALYPEFGLPQQLSTSGIVWNALLNALLLGVGYWLLVRERPRSAGDGAGAMDRAPKS